MDKQIEEMTKETCGQQIYPYGKDRPICWLNNEDCTCRADNQCDHYEVCERIYKAGYRKIPEGAVVLTEDNAEEIGDMVVKSPQMQEAVLHLIKAWQKETAEKFAERVKMAFYYEFDELIPSIMADKIDEICKELVDE